jgi:phosphatidate phosphatase PAH1
MSKIYNQIPSGKILETSNWDRVDDVKNGVKIMRTLSNLEEEKYHQLKSAGATDSQIWKTLRTNKDELENSPLKEGTIQIELTIPLQELTKRQLIRLFNKYAGYELPSMISMRKDDIIKLIHAISPSYIARVKVDDK